MLYVTIYAVHAVTCRSFTRIGWELGLVILVALVFTVLYRQCQHTNFLAILTTLASNLIHYSRVKNVEVEIHLTSKKMAKGELTLQY